MEFDEADTDTAASASVPAATPTLPKLSLSRLIHASLPPDWSCSETAQERIQQCCIELIQLLASESNEMMQRDKKQQIMTHHVLKAVKELEFDNWLPELEALIQAKEAEAKSAPRSLKRRMEQSGRSLDELARRQQEMFQKAKQKMEEKIAKQVAAQTTTTTATTTGSTCHDNV